MSVVTKFQFGTDFREGGRRAMGEAEIEAARDEAFRAGEAQGRAGAEAELRGLAGLIARSAESLMAQEATRAIAAEAQVLHVALAAARRLAGAALEGKPLAAIEGAIRECIVHARLAPHLVLRVNENAVEAAETLVGRLARDAGFAGRLVVLGEPDIAPGDGRIEWADGGMVIDTQQLSAQIEQAVADVFGAGAARSAMM